MTSIHTETLYTMRELEAAIDIAINAGALIRSEAIQIPDSRELVQFIIRRAEVFEHSGLTSHNDYLFAIDDFARHFLLAWYGENTRCATGDCEHPLGEYKRLEAHVAKPRILRLIATATDEWRRQHFRNFDFVEDHDYCAVDDQIRVFKLEPDYPVNKSIDIIEVNDLGQTIKVWQSGVATAPPVTLLLGEVATGAGARSEP